MSFLQGQIIKMKIIVMTWDAIRREFLIVLIIIYVIVLMMTMLILEGQAGGNHYNNKGGASNYLCLPNDPDNGKPYSYANDVLYGVEYDSSVLPTGFPNLYQKEATCAVCRRKGKSSILMIPGIRYSFKYILYNKQVWTQKCAVQKASVDVNISYY
jgi:hypothetical protein